MRREVGRHVLRLGDDVDRPEQRGRDRAAARRPASRCRRRGSRTGTRRRSARRRRRGTSAVSSSSWPSVSRMTWRMAPSSGASRWQASISHRPIAVPPPARSLLTAAVAAWRVASRRHHQRRRADGYARRPRGCRRRRRTARRRAARSMAAAAARLSGGDLAHGSCIEPETSSTRTTAVVDAVTGAPSPSTGPPVAVTVTMASTVDAAGRQVLVLVRLGGERSCRLPSTAGRWTGRLDVDHGDGDVVVAAARRAPVGSARGRRRSAAGRPARPTQRPARRSVEQVVPQAVGAHDETSAPVRSERGHGRRHGRARRRPASG